MYGIGGTNMELESELQDSGTDFIHKCRSMEKEKRPLGLLSEAGQGCLR
jgi:hypothetical protein